MEEVDTNSGGSAARRSLRQIVVADWSRFRRIFAVLRNNGFATMLGQAGMDSEGEGDHSQSININDDPRETARRFRAVLEELGPTFVKVGQILSTRPDVLPPPFVEELRTLQDASNPLPFEEIRGAVETGLGAPIEELYAEFDEEPLASASMAQAHRARLPDGSEVVVKVQRPGIAETMRADLDLMHMFARFMEYTIAEMELYAPGDIVRALDDALSDELDFTVEASNLVAFAHNFKDDPNIHIPRLYGDLSGRTVMTMEKINGRKLIEIAGETDEARHFASLIIDSTYRMVFEFGLFHGDPHPGNLFVTEDNKLAYIDFGLCGRLGQRQQDHLVALIVSIVAGDMDGIARILLQMGRPLGHVRMNAFKAEIADVRERYLKRDLSKIDLTAFVEECIDAAQRYRIRVAPEYAILTKASVTSEGVIRRLAPDLDVVAVAQPYARKLLSRRYSSERLVQEAMNGATSLGYFLREVPDQLSQIMMDIEAGTLSIQVRNEEIDRLGALMNTQATRIFMGIWCAALIIATPLFLAVEPWWLFGRIPVMTTMCAFGAVFVGTSGMAWHAVGARGFRKVRVTPLLKLLMKQR